MENKSPDNKQEEMTKRMGHNHAMHQGHTINLEHVHPEAHSDTEPIQSEETFSQTVSETHTGHKQQASHEEGHHHNVKQMSHQDHTGHEQLFQKRFWISLILTVPVLLFSGGFQMLLGFALPAFPGSQWIAPAFALAISPCL